MTPMTAISSPVRTALCMRAFTLAIMLATVVGCSGSDPAPPSSASVACTGAANCIGSAGGTVTGPDGVQVVIPQGALNQPTTIGIARTSTGYPTPLPEGYLPSNVIYEFTPHDLMFNKPVRIRMPVPTGTVGVDALMASRGGDWQVNGTTITTTGTGDFVEWERNSFSFGFYATACSISPGVSNPYPCSHPRGNGTATSSPNPNAIIGTAVLVPSTGGAASWDVQAATTVRLTLSYQIVPDCITAPGPQVRLLRWNPVDPLNTPNRVTTLLNDVPATLALQTIPLLGGAFGGAGSYERLVGSTTFDVTFSESDYVGIHAFGFSISCTRGTFGRQSGGEILSFRIASPLAPIVTPTIGGTVSGLTGTGLVLQNNLGDNLSVPANATSFIFPTAIAAGGSYSVTVLTQPTGQTCIVPNGSGNNVQANVTNVAVNCTSNVGPVPLVATSIAAGYFSSLAVASDGTVWAWGQNVDPSTGGYKSTSPYATQPVQVQSLADVKAVALSSESGSFYALHNDGTVSAWGLNSNGQLGDRTTSTRFLPVKVLKDATNPIDEVCSIAAGANMLLMARDESCSPSSSGILSGPWIVGQFSGQNIGGSSNGTIAIAVPGLPAGVAVSRMSAYDAASGGGAVFFRLASGSKYVWGNNGSNRLGAGTGTSFAGGTGGPVEVSFFWSGTCCTELGRNFSVTMDETSTLAAVGSNLDHQFGNGTDVGSSSLTPAASGLTNVTALSAGQVSAAAITSGQLWVWGTLGFGPVYNYSLPTRLGTGTGFTQVSVGDAHGLAIGLNGEVYSWGENTNGALGRSGSGSGPAVVMRP